MRVVEEFGQFGNTFGVSISLEFEAFALEESLQLLVVSDDTIVDYGKLPLWIRPVRCQLSGILLVNLSRLLVWVAVVPGRLAVGSPSSVCNTSMRIEDLGHVGARVVDELSELGDLAHLFEREDFISLVTVDG